MKKLIVLGFLGMLSGSMSINLAAAEVPPTDEITVQAHDEQTVIIPRDVAQLSTTFRDYFEQYSKETSIPLPKVEGFAPLEASTLNLLVRLMTYAYPLQNEPLKERIQKIGAKIRTELANAPMEKRNALFNAISFLDVEILKAPLANAMIQKIHAENQGDRELIEATVLSLHVPDDCKELLAKYWYLNFGDNKNYILPDLEYGFSIEEFAAYEIFPIVEHLKTGRDNWILLNLNESRINDLTGLQSIPDFASIDTLNLSGNKLTSLPQDIFDQLQNLQRLLLVNNKLTTLPLGIFDKLQKLNYLDLAYNMITTLPQGLFAALDKLYELRLENNQLTALPQELFAESNKSIQLYLSNNPLTTDQKEALRQQFGPRVRF